MSKPPFTPYSFPPVVTHLFPIIQLGTLHLATKYMQVQGLHFDHCKDKRSTAKEQCKDRIRTIVADDSVGAAVEAQPQPPYCLRITAAIR